MDNADKNINSVKLNLMTSRGIIAFKMSIPSSTFGKLFKFK